MTTVADGVGAMCHMITELYRLVHSGVAGLWPDVKRILTTLAWVYLQTVRLVFHAFLIPLVVVVVILGVPVWLLEKGISLADFAVARFQ